VILVAYEVAIVSNADRVLCIQQLYDLLQTNSIEMSLESPPKHQLSDVVLNSIFKKPFLEINELQAIREDMRSNAVFAMVRYV
jgi:hypothetical protein